MSADAAGKSSLRHNELNASVQCHWRLTPFSGFYQLAVFAADQIALERAYVRDV